MGARSARLVEHGVQVNARSLRTRRTPFEEAQRNHHHEIAEYLVQHGAERIELGELEAFALACISGNREEVRARLAQDATILDRLGHYGRLEMLHRAVEARQQGGVRLIVELGVDINGMVPGTGLDRTVLHNSAGWVGLDIVKLLVELGADPNLRDLTYRGTAIGWALYNGQSREVIEYLLPFAGIVDAVRCGSLERAGALLQGDPSLVGARDQLGNPLVFGLNPATPRLDEMIRLLVSHGADLNARDGAGKTILARALERGLEEFADTLRAHGALT